MFPTRLFIGCAGLFALTSCSKEQAEYRFSSDQLSWQGYQAGEELRFGNRQSSKVRVYSIVSVADRMQEEDLGMAIIGSPFSRKKPSLCQRITVDVRRTDTVAYGGTCFDMEAYSPSGAGEIPLQAIAGWESFYQLYLPVNEINKGAAIDTLLFGPMELLRNVTFGAITYPLVIHATNRYRHGLPGNGIRPTRHLYYARNKGVVAFEEAGTGLWYRLP